jgi:hypothetical protein
MLFRWQATAKRSESDPSLIVLHFMGWDESRDEVRGCALKRVSVLAVMFLAIDLQSLC